MGQVYQNQNGSKIIELIKMELEVASQTHQWFWTSLVSEPTFVLYVKNLNHFNHPFLLPLILHRVIGEPGAQDGGHAGRQGTISHTFMHYGLNVVSKSTILLGAICTVTQKTQDSDHLHILRQPLLCFLNMQVLYSWKPLKTWDNFRMKVVI